MLVTEGRRAAGRVIGASVGSRPLDINVPAAGRLGEKDSRRGTRGQLVRGTVEVQVAKIWIPQEAVSLVNQGGKFKIRTLERHPVLVFRLPLTRDESSNLVATRLWSSWPHYEKEEKGMIRIDVLGNDRSLATPGNAKVKNRKVKDRTLEKPQGAAPHTISVR
jgi:hypothetical protein